MGRKKEKGRAVVGGRSVRRNPDSHRDGGREGHKLENE